MSAKAFVTPGHRSFSATDRLSALMQMTGDLETAETLHATFPPWLASAAPEKIAALAADMARLQACQLTVQPALDALQPLHEFCRSALDVALTDQYKVAFNVEQDSVDLPALDCGCEESDTPDKASKPVATARRGLLQAAMHNFTEDEAKEGGFPAGGTVRLAAVPDGLAELTPMAFAETCRTVDLGRRYQEHFAATLGSPALNADIRQLKKSALMVDAHCAYLKGHIGESAFDMTQRLRLSSGTVGQQGATSVLYDRATVHLQGLEFFGACIWGVVIFSKRALKDHPTDGCVVYMPNEPNRPFYEYRTFTHFNVYLHQQLKNRAYADFFTGYIDETNRVAFCASITRQEDWELRTPALTFKLFDFLYESHVTKMQTDARSLAVPTAEIDAAVRLKRLLSYEEAGLLIANIAGLFVPLVGQLMMGVAVGQLLGEVYDGIEDWIHDEKAIAMAHLLSVAENIAMMAAFAAGTKAIGSLIKRTVAEHPVFFGRFTAVLNGQRKPRLWKSDVVPYQQPSMPARVVETGGIYRVDGRQLVRVDDAVFEVAFDAELRQWRVCHPARAAAYSPVVEHNGDGGWRFVHEQPEGWLNGFYLLRRIDPQLSDFDEAQLEQLRAITGTPLSDLHRLVQDNQALPARLKDCAERLRIDRKLNDFISDLHAGYTQLPEHAPTQLQALPSLPGWPEHRYIEVLDSERKVVATYPKTLFADDELSLVVTEDQIGQGQLLQTVVDGLYASEVKALVGEDAAKGLESTALARKLGAAVKADRLPVFNHFYGRYDQSAVTDVQTLRVVFPDLPARLALELIASASSAERLHLRATGRVTLNLAQSAREATAKIGLDHALTGLYLPSIGEAGTHRLAFGLLPRLHGWSSDLSLQLREGSVTGALSASIGSAQAATRRIIVRATGGHQLYDSSGASLGARLFGADGLYDAILSALPESRRAAMGFGPSMREAGSELRAKLLSLGLEDRAVTERIFAGTPVEEARAPAQCLQSDEPAATSTYSKTLMRKVKKLYPLFTDAQARVFLDGLGTDALTQATAVKRHRQALKTLRKALDSWSGDEVGASTSAGLREQVQSRRQVADQIENCWRRLSFLREQQGVAVPGLKLDGMRVGQLPTLPPEVKFDHIRSLSLKNMELDDNVAYFLKTFRNLESLALDNNTVTRLPEVLSMMPALKHLSLASNDLQLTEQTLKKLSSLRTLETLNLSGNRRLGATLDVGKLFDLRYLSLRDTRAGELPKNLAHLPNLDRIDLRDNDIKSLPDWLLNTPRQFSESVNLRNNPLSNASRTRLKAYRDRVGVGMGYLEDDIERLNEQRAAELWLPDKWTSPSRTATWTAFKDEPAADGLFRLLAELGASADNEHVQEEMTRRVWSVLDAAQANTSLREQLFELAANPINCTDSAALNFSHLEVATEVHKVVHPTGDARSGAAALLKLGRGLFRLDQLDKIAQAHIDAHPAADPLEVSLAFRTGLVEVFELPGQPRHMRYAALSGVTQAALDRAKSQITTAELSSQLLEFLVRQPFWIDYLKREYPRQFGVLDSTYPARMQALFETAESLDSADYLRQVSVIKEERDAAQSSILEELTDQAIRIADVGICGLAEY